MKDINEMKYLVKFLTICLLISYLGAPVFSNDISEAQEILIELGYDIGSIDGVVGKKTLKAINSLYFKNNLPEITSIRSKDLQRLVEIKKKKMRPIPWIFHDKFTSINWSRYDKTHINLNIAAKGNAQIIKEPGGNSYISLASIPGQLSYHNRGDNRYIKDRVELGTPYSKSNYILNNRLVWYGFKIKSKEPKFKPKAHSITFTQIKQIHKNQKKKSCYNGMFWRMNTQSDGLTWMAVTKENGEKINKTYLPNFINDEWTHIKVGIYFSDSNNGWLKAYIDSELVYEFNGRTVRNIFENCIPVGKNNTYFRIGVYRGSDSKLLTSKKVPDDQRDELHFDDFIVSNNETSVDKALGY